MFLDINKNIKPFFVKSEMSENPIKHCHSANFASRPKFSRDDSFERFFKKKFADSTNKGAPRSAGLSEARSGNRIF